MDLYIPAVGEVHGICIASPIKYDGVEDPFSINYERIPSFWLFRIQISFLP